jgi:hypothetical protein
MAATTNINVGTAWVKLANASDVTVLISHGKRATVQLAATNTDVAPTTVLGHDITLDDAITRDILGPGFIWARCLTDTIAVKVTK